MNGNAFLQSNCNSSDFGSVTIISHNFNPSDFYPNFHVAFEASLNKFNAHIPSHPAHPLFIFWKEKTYVNIDQSKN